MHYVSVGNGTRAEVSYCYEPDELIVLVGGTAIAARFLASGDRICLEDGATAEDALVKQTNEQMAVLNVLDEFNCIDHQASNMTYVEKDDKFSNRKAGDPETVFSLRIDPSTVRDQMIFRISGYRQALVFHEQLVHALRDASLSGVAFVEV
ncbi:imm11 family protein [Stieleria magnilauensis]|uniref:imm11 family protein n=1 Tax=Stieleria magnilauensis TaxID=2527963 RepID=UPI003AF99FD8